MESDNVCELVLVLYLMPLNVLLKRKMSKSIQSRFYSVYILYNTLNKKKIQNVLFFCYEIPTVSVRFFFTKMHLAWSHQFTGIKQKKNTEIRYCTKYDTIYIWSIRSNIVLDAALWTIHFSYLPADMCHVCLCTLYSTAMFTLSHAVGADHTILHHLYKCPCRSILKVIPQGKISLAAQCESLLIRIVRPAYFPYSRIKPEYV